MPSVRKERQQSISDQVLIVSHRAVIEQAKGMLMLTYQVNAEAAFAILVWRSQQLNLKVATIAEKLVADLPNLANSDPARRAPIDHYLITLKPPKTRGR